MDTANNEKKMAALEAVKEIKDGMTIGLGTGSTAYYAIHAVAELIRQGMTLKTVPTSEQTKQMSIELGIPMVDINSIDSIDVTIDGADEFTQNLELIKGGGGALLREKIVASITKKQIIITDSSKMVHQLGKFKVPIEVIPMACSYVMRQLTAIGGIGLVRTKEGKDYITDQGNLIIDADFGLIEHPAVLDEQLNKIVGIVEHGLFIGLAHKVIMIRDGETITFSA
ncbi:ribose-5-phosphate isomerase RpiA [Niabella hibiscisoli]|uniref:ribose-5-phosphate isomerase RpiA n=1 Tax=Niabella hibiscisoli TaxID=1825928 RepID=UPI001F0D2CA4|nr:ribose-5-phosphate isomerase RpiA [Niabella hibiscisoli]MCH5715125.1 ribose-5-phosphate isomerase RpiA [Niabella hibiscisoli]